MYTYTIVIATGYNLDGYPTATRAIKVQATSKVEANQIAVRQGYRVVRVWL